MKCILLLVMLSVLALGATEDLREGLHESVKIPHEKWTFDAYLPKGYYAHPQRSYPTLFLSSPAGNPKTAPWHAWADRTGFVVIAINDTRNGQEFSLIDKIQDQTLEACTEVIRVHRVLRYASGMSGGAWCSVRLATRHPDHWAGVEMSAHSGNGDVAPKWIAIGMYSGRNDKVHPYKDQAAVAALYKKAGNPIQFVSHSGGHENGDIGKDVQPLIEFCYAQTVFALPTLTKDERAEQSQVIQEQIEQIATLTDPKLQRESCEKFAEIALIEKTTCAKALAQTWAQSLQNATVDIRDGRERHFVVGMTLANPIFNLAPSALKKKVQDDQRELSKDPTLKDEVRALQALLKIIATEKVSDDTPAKRKLIDDIYRQLAKALPATKAGMYAAKQDK